jgi:Na+/proline symporter
MSFIDWTVLTGTLALIIGYGIWKTRKTSDLEEYLLGGKQMRWATIGLSVMATQASAITFLSTPGQAYESGMAFVQNYFGMPLAIIIVSAIFIPVYFKRRVYTSYEYLESRYDLKVRLLAAFLFLLQRGLAAGITIYAPSIILSTILDWDLSLTILVVGFIVVIYTVSGGTKAVSLTQKWQMAVILMGMGVAFFLIMARLPKGIGLMEGLTIAGGMGKLNIVDFSFDPGTRYTFWTGITGGLFLALSYFGTDQSQVQRYIGAKSVTESRLGLMFNALFKVPMQFLILLTGVMVFVFYQFNLPPLLFNENTLESMPDGRAAREIIDLRKKHAVVFEKKKESIEEFIKADKTGGSEKDLHINSVQTYYKESIRIRDRAKELVNQSTEDATAKDSDFVFLSFILNYLPHGIIGLLIAVIISAAMSSTSGELNALGSTFTMDFYKRAIYPHGTDHHYLNSSKIFTAMWGVIAIFFALFAHLVENLIEAVNILGSIFYGTILGIFLTAMFLKMVNSRAAFLGGVIAQIVVFILFYLFSEDVAYLWYNLIGCFLVVVISLLLSINSLTNGQRKKLST